MAIITWPRELLCPESERWSRSGRVIAGGQAVSGAMPTGRTDGGGFWIDEQQGICLDGADKIKLWRMMETLVGDGVTEFLMPMCEGAFRPRPAGEQLTDIPHSDDTLFSDDVGYAQSAVTGSVLGAAIRRATTISITLGAGTSLTGGENFSITHPTVGQRAYNIGSVEMSGQVATVKIWPPLREALAGGETADFQNVGVLVRVADPSAFAAPIQAGSYGFADITFVEAL